METTSLGMGVTMWEAGLLPGTQMYRGWGVSMVLEVCFPFGYLYNIL